MDFRCEDMNWIEVDQNVIHWLFEYVVSLPVP
jgi:hypothetical protein